MQTQDAPAEIMFKFWPWFEANRKRLIVIFAAAVVGFFVWFFISTQRQQNELAAGQAYTQFQVSQPPTSSAKQVADGYLVLAAKYPDTAAGQRARLQSAAVLFSAGNYAEAHARFQNFLATDSGSSLAVLARLGVAACLESEGKLDDALAAYRAATSAVPGSTEAIVAKYSQGRILELQGKAAESLNLYKEVANSPLAGSLASEAAQRIALLQTKLAAVQPLAKP
jgi:predicted negative regulator of RcsB-dependent stress response